ncbi:MAG TPA: carboxypeptidase-like regulatory domain-containing protein, partial [Candidatus Eisenbacteria bacterium]|nr:carboxypeptidase-like regulatory domain-containing protein [Candidatus Eisenbacteria bacterium]
MKNNSRLSRVPVVIFVAVVVALWGSVGAAPTLRAQEAAASISGVVKDQQDAAIPDATVILLDNAAVRLQRVKTDENGDFAFSGVRQGSYVVEVERAGFARASVSVNVRSSAEAKVAIQLKVAGPGQQVM